MFSKTRLDTLSDGIFAVAMTLLVLDVRLPEDFQPRDGSELLEGLTGLWPKFLPYALSFCVLGLRWLANIEIRTRADFVNREYVNWWLLYLRAVFDHRGRPLCPFRAGDLALRRPHARDRTGRHAAGRHHAPSGAGRPFALPVVFGCCFDRVLMSGDRRQFCEPAAGAVGACPQLGRTCDESVVRPPRAAGLNRRRGAADYEIKALPGGKNE
jgi:hypothetical protein